MPAVTLYLSDPDYQLYLKLDKGERSQIYGEAIRMKLDNPRTIEDVNRKIEAAEQERLKIDLKVTFWEARKAKMKEQEAELQRQKELLEMKKEGGLRWTMHNYASRFKEVTGREMTLEDAQEGEEWTVKNKRDFLGWLSHLKEIQS